MSLISDLLFLASSGQLHPSSSWRLVFPAFGLVTCEFDVSGHWFVDEICVAGHTTVVNAEVNELHVFHCTIIFVSSDHILKLFAAKLVLDAPVDKADISHPSLCSFVHLEKY